jgi:hypothetical protein
MSALNLYNVVINGFATTVQLTEADAVARGLTATHRADLPKAAESAPASRPAKARNASNKARTAANKAE